MSGYWQTAWQSKQWGHCGVHRHLECGVVRVAHVATAAHAAPEVTAAHASTHVVAGSIAAATAKVACWIQRKPLSRPVVQKLLNKYWNSRYNAPVTPNLPVSPKQISPPILEGTHYFLIPKFETHGFFIARHVMPHISECPSYFMKDYHL